MSAINLSPDVTLIGIQASLFLSNVFIVKKLMLEPYLKVRDEREKKTQGHEGTAERLMKEADSMDRAIADKLRVAHQKASQRSNQIKSDAMSQRTALIAKAETEAKAAQVALLSEIKTNLAEESARKSEAIAAIKKELMLLATQ